MRPLLYFIQEGTDGPIKIGVTGDPGERLKRLQIGNPRELVALHTFDCDPQLERFLHRRLEAHRIRGEWFHPHEEVYSVIEDCYEQFVIAPLLREPVAA